MVILLLYEPTDKITMATIRRSELTAGAIYMDE
jgi:hypothetical protein